MPLDTSDTFTPGENPTAEKLNRVTRNNLTWLKGAIPGYTASTISALASDNSYNDSASGFPNWALAAGDFIHLSFGWSNPANNAIDAVIVSATASKIVVSGPTLVDEAAGANILFQFQQAYTSRGVLLKAPEFRHDGHDGVGDPVQAELRHTYSGTPGQSTHRYLTDLLSVDLAEGSTGKLMGSVADPENDAYELLGFLQWTRAHANEGTLSFNAFYLSESTGTQVATTGLSIDSSGHVLINAFSGSYAVNVLGDVRAAAYLNSGSAIGVWILDTSTEVPTMTFAGSASATKWTAFDFDVLSETETVNPNAQYLRGETWQDTVITAVTGSPVTCPARSGQVTYSFTVSAVTTVSANADDQSFNDSAGGFPADIINPGDEVAFTGFENGQNNRTFTVVSITANKVIVSGAPVVTESAGSVDITWTLGYTVIAQSAPVTRAGYYSVEGEIAVPTTDTFGAYYAKCTGSPAGSLGAGYSPFYFTPKAVGEIESLSVCGKANLAVGDTLRLYLSNTTDAPAAASGSLTARWTATGQDLNLLTFRLGLVLYPFTVT